MIELGFISNLISMYYSCRSQPSQRTNVRPQRWSLASGVLAAGYLLHEISPEEYQQRVEVTRASRSIRWILYLLSEKLILSTPAGFDTIVMSVAASL